MADCQNKAEYVALPWRSSRSPGASVVQSTILHDLCLSASRMQSCGISAVPEARDMFELRQDAKQHVLA